ncbi:MAG: hypothetical protein L3V56_04230 [Candidatus Magnetoovum sp. WYHC-5]|nr:hypothetical protein [Candidatus Magnetoovum sp. WYHC-5]
MGLNMTIKDKLKQEIDKLPDDIALEIYDLMLSLEAKRETTMLTKQVQELSNLTFSKIWDNEIDEVYDNI